MMTGLSLFKPCSFFIFTQSDIGTPKGDGVYKIIKKNPKTDFYSRLFFHWDTPARHFIFT